jgi:hypothetical protein
MELEAIEPFGATGSNRFAGAPRADWQGTRTYRVIGFNAGNSAAGA